MNKELIKSLVNKEAYTFSDLCDIMTVLRGDGGCPWDREQTHKSIRGSFIEETYEAIEAIDNDDAVLLREELGDVMLQVVFHAEMEHECGVFDINDVISDECKKLIYRHPHIFTDGLTLETSEQVLTKWEELKSKEKNRKTSAEKLKSIPPSLPALMRADKLGSVSKKAGFDFESAEAAFLKIPEETAEVKAELEAGNKERLFEEVGDLLLSVVNMTRLAGIDAEEALSAACNKYTGRFERLENEVRKHGHDIADFNMSELDEIWDSIKHENTVINTEK